MAKRSDPWAKALNDNQAELYDSLSRRGIRRGIVVRRLYGVAQDATVRNARCQGAGPSWDQM